jgi:uncharacterized membrane protein YbaN (DUF454 family)
MKTLPMVSDSLPDLLAPPRPDRPFLVRLLMPLLGVMVVAVGIVGWILPFVIGAPLVVVGLGMIAYSSERLRHGFNSLERRLPLRCRLWLRPRMKRSAKRPEEKIVARLFEQKGEI